MVDIQVQKLCSMLPSSECCQDRAQRDLMWTRWDTTSNMFLSVQELEQELLQWFNITPSQDITEIIRQSSIQVKRRHKTDGHYGPNYIQKREFKCFLQNIQRHVKAMTVFKSVDKDQDNLILQQELNEAYVILVKQDLGEEKRALAQQISRSMEFTFTQFDRWLDICNFYSPAKRTDLI